MSAKYSEEPLVMLTTADSEPIARMWAEALQNQGIDCMVKAVGGAGIAGVWAGPVVEHEIWVRQSQAEQAAALLQELRAPEDGDDENTDTEE